ncbi:MAG: hypothetical protein M1812_000168 [Candelaria pacifica]|nr:MAG: hypothetical protein M1812_000168 [Candelaria pacifica]
MFIPRQYRTPKVLYGLFALEFPLTVAVLALYGIAAPDLYRTKLWQDGADNGFNSNPSQVIYSYANYQPVSKTPLVWSSFLTNYNVVIAVLSMFLMLVKGIMFITRVFPPLLSVLVHAALTALYAFSVHAQVSKDLNDPKHPQNGPPWYLTKSCSVSFKPANVGYCQQAKATFAVTVIVLALFAINTILAIYNTIPSKEQKLARHASSDSGEEGNMKDSPDSDISNRQQWEMQNVPRAPRTPGTTGGMKSPMTPRTQAFNTLGGNEGNVVSSREVT